MVEISEDLFYLAVGIAFAGLGAGLYADQKGRKFCFYALG